MVQAGGKGCLGPIHLQAFAFQKLEKLQWIMQWRKERGGEGEPRRGACGVSESVGPAARPREVMGPPREWPPDVPE